MTKKHIVTNVKRKIDTEIAIGTEKNGNKYGENTALKSKLDLDRLRARKDDLEKLELYLKVEPQVRILNEWTRICRV